MILDFGLLQSSWFLIIRHYKTQGRVFSNVGENDAEYKNIIFIFVFYFSVLIIKDGYSIYLKQGN